jgi:hypothetical protein
MTAGWTADSRAGGGSVGDDCHIAGENCPVGALGGVGGWLTGDGDDGRMTQDGDDEWWMTPRVPAAAATDGGLTVVSVELTVD